MQEPPSTISSLPPIPDDTRIVESNSTQQDPPISNEIVISTPDIIHSRPPTSHGKRTHESNTVQLRGPPEKKRKLNSYESVLTKKEKEIQIKNKRIKALQQKIRRRNGKVKSLKDAICYNEEEVTNNTITGRTAAQKI